MAAPQYPAGPLRPEDDYGPRRRGEFIAGLEGAPAALRRAVAGLSDGQLDTRYRNWTVRQIVHHVPDSHMNAYIRMKLAATEDSPTVKTYDEAKWAELPEARTAPVEVSLALVDALHRRWVAFLRALPEADLRRTFMHADWGRVTIEESIAMYSWHCRHHAAHISIALGRPVDAGATSLG